ncbi:hypothetical protein Hanom_Chr12g01142641 [Helianthus anomalus]
MHTSSRSWPDTPDPTHAGALSTQYGSPEGRRGAVLTPLSISLASSASRSSEHILRGADVEAHPPSTTPSSLMLSLRCSYLSPYLHDTIHISNKQNLFNGVLTSKSSQMHIKSNT